MTEEILLWDVYEITSKESSLNGVMLRGRIRKLGIIKSFNVLAENTEDTENSIRFAVLNKESADTVQVYIKSIIEDAVIELKLRAVPNPIISKLKVNIESRYTL